MSACDDCRELQWETNNPSKKCYKHDRDRGDEEDDARNQHE
jgi:hypothetical protein